MPFVNNYGVWKDEFRELGLESTLDVSWDDAMCYFGETKEVRVGRGYGRCLAEGPMQSRCESAESTMTSNYLGTDGRAY